VSLAPIRIQFGGGTWGDCWLASARPRFFRVRTSVRSYLVGGYCIPPTRSPLLTPAPRFTPPSWGSVRTLRARTGGWGLPTPPAPPTPRKYLCFFRRSLFLSATLAGAGSFLACALLRQQSLPHPSPPTPYPLAPFPPWGGKGE
jgi:hypothetical protein